jgi:hypothetical protein
MQIGLSSLALFCRLAIALAFAYSGPSKLWRLRPFVRSLESIGINGRMGTVTGLAIVLAEAGTALVLLVGDESAQLIGFGAAAVLLAGFTAFVAGRLREPRAARGACLCFGKEEIYGVSHLVRNATLILLAVGGITISVARPALPAIPLDEVVVTFVAAVVAVAVAVNLADLARILSIGPVETRNGGRIY